ncbi:class I tRNA ligase family protein [Streptomyces mesophilus]|uniref:class I tRNA ligase family protein n=1 Tax=Streptomyces mesophilus TaxID=1775132 RepID=UPI003329DBF4
MGSYGSYVITSSVPSPDSDPHPGQLLALLGADVLGRHLSLRGHRVRHVRYCAKCPCPPPCHDLPALTAQARGERVQRSFLSLWQAGVWEQRELPGPRCEPCGRNLHETEVRGRCGYCAAPCNGTYCHMCERPQDAEHLAALRCVRCGQVPVRTTTRRLVLPLERWRERLVAYHAMDRAQAREPEAVGGRRQRAVLHTYLSELLGRELPAVPVSQEDGHGVPIPLAGWKGHVLDSWFSGAVGYAEAVAASLGRTGQWEETSGRSRVEKAPRIIDFAGVGQVFSHAVLRPVVLLALGAPELPNVVVGHEAARPPAGTPSAGRGTPEEAPDADALRFHLCLTGFGPEWGTASARAYADTVATVLTGGLETWTDTVLDLLAEDFGSTVPAAAPEGPPAAERGELMRRAERSLAAGSFSLQRAAEEFATVVDRAVADLQPLRRLRAAGRYSAYEARLVAHVELLASCAVAAGPLMPGWSAFLTGHLSIGPDEERGRMRSPAAGGTTRLVPAGARLPESVPAYFHEHMQVP